MSDARAIRSVCILGAGPVGLSAALAFARALPGVRISVVASPADPAALADRAIASLPTIHRFHSAIGVDELSLVRDGAASHHLGTRFENWSASGAPWFHVFDDHGLPADGVPFHQLWTELRRSGRAEPFHHYAAAAWLAQTGKFVHPQDDARSPLSAFLYGLRLDPVRYRARLLAEAKRAGIDIAETDVAGRERREDGGVNALRLADGRSLQSDLFLDCAGPSAPLRSALDSDFEDWGNYLPCDRVTFASEVPSDSPHPVDQVSGMSEGWRWSAALPASAVTGRVWSSNFADEGAAQALLQSDGGFGTEETVAVRSGRRPEPWKHNVLALGDAATAVDPLHSTHLHLAHSAILRALELLPGRDCHPLELHEYNRRTAQETSRVCDFLALHYLRSGRSEGPFWTSAARAPVPDSLAHTLDQFETRGRLPFYEEETFGPQSWLAVLAGLGVLPKAIDPVSARIDLDQAEASMAQLAQRLATLPGRLPEYADYLRRMTG